MVTGTEDRYRILIERQEQKRHDKKRFSYSIRKKAEALLNAENEWKELKNTEPKKAIERKQKIKAYIPTVIAVLCTVFALMLCWKKQYLEALILGIVSFYFWYYRKRPLRILEEESEIEDWNEKLKQKQEHAEENYQEVKKEFLALYQRELGKEEKIGVFFETPYNPERSFRTYCKENEKNQILYRFGNENSYEDEEKKTHLSITRTVGELHFSFRDKAGQKIKDFSKIKEGSLYEEGFYPFQTCTLGEVLPYFEDEKFSVLYSDEDLLLENTEGEYRLSYICDMDVVSYAEEVKSYPLKSFDIYEMLEKLEQQNSELTRIFTKNYSNYSEYICGYEDEKAQNPKIYSHEEIIENYTKSKEAGKYCYVGEDWKVQKKACILWYYKQIAAIFVPRESESILKINYIYDRPFLVVHQYSREEKNIGCRIDQIEEQKSENRLADLASTMAYIVKELSVHMQPVDVMETFADGIPEELWRLWIEQRYLIN